MHILTLIIKIILIVNNIYNLYLYFIGKPYLVVIGGNTGTTPVNDVWALNIERVPY